MKNTLRILLIEDSSADAELIEYEIRKSGVKYELRRVMTKDEFISQAKELKPDIILSDYSLPQFNGMTALLLAKDLIPDIPFILVTGSINEETAVECMKAGADDYIIKEHLKRLVPAIESALQNKEVKSQKEKVQYALRESEERFRSLVESMNDIVFLLDENKCITNVYGQWLKIKNVSDSLFLNKHICEVFNTEQPDIIEDAIKKAFGGGYVISECTFKVNDEVFFMQISISPVFEQSSDNVTHLVGVARDVTENKLAELELVDAKNRAMESDRLKSVFLAQVSHEIRTPLNTIISYINLIKDDLTPHLPEDMTGSFNAINNGVKRLIRTIDLILNMSQIQTGYFEPHPQILDLYREILIPVTTELLSGVKQKNVELKLESETKDCFVKCDFYSVSQIFINLIENAIKFTPEGIINVRIFRNEDDNLCVEVKDTGIGISREYLVELFTPFSQEEMGYTRRFEGNGLGLALVKKYCEMNNADIKVVSEKGRGSSFVVIFK